MKSAIDKIYAHLGYMKGTDRPPVKQMLWAYRLGRKEANEKWKKKLQNSINHTHKI